MSERPDSEIDVMPEQVRRDQGPKFDFVDGLYQDLGGVWNDE